MAATAQPVPQFDQTRPRRIIVGLSGSTGPHYGVRLLEVLREHLDLITRWQGLES